jgi:hypothetical protein
MKSVYKLIKQLIEVTQNRVIFVGSFTDYLRGIKDSFGDIDIIIPEEVLPSLKVFGEIEKLDDHCMFKGKKRYCIHNKIKSIDVFIGENLKTSTYETLLFGGSLFKVFTVKSEIAELREITKIDFHPKFKLKLIERIYKLMPLTTDN